MEYTAVVSKIKVRPHPDADRIQIGTVCSVDVIVGLETSDGDLGLYFAPDGQLGEKFAEANNLVGKVDPETGKKTGGYFGKNRRIKAQKFRGVNSYGFWIPIESLNNLGVGEDVAELFKEGESITKVNGVPICNKYITPATRNAMKNQSGTLRRSNTLFAKHFDTDHLRKNLKKIPEGAILHFTEKLHGTSGRTGYIYEDYMYKRPLWVTFCCGLMNLDFRRNVPSKRYATITGTRNVILKERAAPGFYGREEFRGIMEDKVRGLLRKGEILYYEIVGYTTNGRSIMPSVEISDRKLRKIYGNSMSYTYGCKEKECEMYIYRIVNVNEDGVAIDLPWSQVMQRCKELGVKPVPSMDWNFTIDDSNGELNIWCNYSEKAEPTVYDGDPDFLLEIIEEMVEGKSLLDQSHIREGVVLRVETEHGVKAYKEKSHIFLTLEGLAKDKDDYVDMEEAT